MATQHDEHEPTGFDQGPDPEAAYRVADEQGSAEGAWRLGMLLEERGDLSGAQVAYRRADARGDGAGALNLAGLLRQQGKLEAAEAAYRRADERGLALGTSGLAELLHQRGDETGAEEAAGRADARSDGYGASLLGLLLLQRGDPVGAEAAYCRADERGYAEGSVGYGVCLEGRGDIAGAEEAYRRGDARGSGAAASKIGVHLANRGDVEGAIAAYLRAEERGDISSAIQLGNLFYQQGDLDAAEAAYRRADVPGDGAASNGVGSVLYRRGDVEGAEAAFLRAEACGDLDGTCNLGSLLRRRGDLEGAAAMYRRAYERGDVTAATDLISVLLWMGSDAEAYRTYDDAMDSYPTDRAMLVAVGLARVLLELGQPQAAAPAARRATELEPGSGGAWHVLGDVLTLCGEGTAADAAFRRSRQLEDQRDEPMDDPFASERPIEDREASAKATSAVGRPDGLLSRAVAAVGRRGKASQTEVDRRAAQQALLRLAEKITTDYGVLIAGHRVDDFPVPKERLDRLKAELEPLLSTGAAIAPNFSELGTLTLEFSSPVQMQVFYTDWSARTTLNGHRIVGSRRRMRLDATSSPPFEMASSFEISVIHGQSTEQIRMANPELADRSSISRPGPPPLPREARFAPPQTAPLSDGQRCTGDAECVRARIGRTDRCLAHVDQALVPRALAEHVGVIDARNLLITYDLNTLAIETRRLIKSWDFTGARFEVEARFDDCDFLAGMCFDGTLFTQGARFSGSKFVRPTSFSGAQFSGRCDFTQTRFYGAALFDDADFSHSVGFAQASFHGGASFGRTRFRGEASFEGCRFRTDTNSIFTSYVCGAASFADSIFESPPVLVDGTCVFDGARFRSEHIVRVGMTCQALSVVDTEFNGSVELSLFPCDVIADGATFARNSTLATSRVVNFKEAERSLSQSPWSRVRLISVRGARLHNVVLIDIDLRGCHFDGAHGLDTMRIEGTDVFAQPPRGWRWRRRPVLAEEWSWRAFGVRGGPKLDRVDDGLRIRDLQRERGWSKIPPECHRPSVFAGPSGPIPRRRLVAIYRDLRKGREDNRDQLNAADFYYSEMEMRRQRDHSSVLDGERRGSWVDRALVSLFWAISGYDVRPLRSATAFLLVLVLGAIAILYTGFKHSLGFGDALVTSAGAMTAVFAPIDSDHLNPAGQVFAILLKIIGPVLLAMTALGIRARAQR